MNKKIVMLFILVFFLVSSISVVYAAIPNPTDVIGKAFDKIIDFFSGKKFDDAEKFVGFMRFLFFLLIFILFYVGGRVIFKEQSKSIPVIIAAILALISVIFIPQEVILGVVTTYSVITASLLLGIPIVATIYLVIYQIPSDNRFWLFLKSIICFLIWFVLVFVVNKIEGAGLMAAGVF